MNVHGKEASGGYNRTVLQRAAEVIIRYNMFAPGARVGVGVSGGADSVCLLHLLNALASGWNLALTVLHLDHGLRGEESRADAAFVRELAAGLGWPCLIGQAQLDPAENLEQAAREARLTFFRESALQEHLACVATGHTRDDQAETVLFRFLRGTGSAGLAGVRPTLRANGLMLVRPLIEIRRVEIEVLLLAQGHPWRTDSSNVSQQFARNRIRRDLLPQLEREWNPAIRDSLAQAADLARAEEAYWEAEIDRLAARCFTEVSGFVLIDVNQLAKLPLAAARRLVRRAIERVKGDLRSIDFLHVESILAMAAGREGHGRFQAPGVDVFRSFEWLRFGGIWAEGLADRNYSKVAPVPGGLGEVGRVVGPEVEISLELIEKPTDLHSDACVYNKEMGWLDLDRLSGSLVLRNWRPGDQYQAKGRSHAEKIKTLFQEFRIPLWERRHWPILMDGEFIVWARRFGVAAAFAANSGSRRILQIRESETDRTASIRVMPEAEAS